MNSPFFQTIRVHSRVVVNGRIVQLFMDGKLHSATKLNTAPWKSQQMMKLGSYNKTFNGYLGLVDYYNRAITVEEVEKLYNKRNDHFLQHCIHMNNKNI